MTDDLALSELLDQINYCLSLQFKEKWRHRFSSNFIDIFQDRILQGFKSTKAIKLSSILSLFIKKHGYSPIEVFDFFKAIEVEIYYPLIYEDKKFILQKKKLKL